MNKTDLIFYLSIVGLVTTTLKDAITKANPMTLTDWIVLSLGVISTLAYGFYDKLTGTRATPQ